MITGNKQLVGTFFHKKAAQIDRRKSLPTAHEINGNKETLFVAQPTQGVPIAKKVLSSMCRRNG